MSVTPLRSLYREVACGYDGPVFVSCFFGWPSSRILSALSAAQAEHLRSHPRVYNLSIVPPLSSAQAFAPAGTTAERDRLIEMTVATNASIESSVAGTAMVILPTGLMGVLIRTFVATAMLNPRMRMKVVTTTSIADAEAHLRSIKDGPPVPYRLTESVAEWLRSITVVAQTDSPR